jgi:hypothetical protein
MLRWFLLVSCAATVLLSGCSAEYYARRAALREQRLAERAQRRYAAEQQRMMEMCGYPQRAYERGHNAGLARQPMDTSWVAQCPYELQQQLGAAYVTGYQEGASRAPAQVVMAAPPPHAVVVGGGYVPGVVACRFSSDCGASMNCRPWGNAGSVCMGYGGSGSPCWFGSDCVFGWCDGTGQRTCR